MPSTSHPSVWEPTAPRVPWTFPTTPQANDMEAPICLIENRPGKKLQVNQEALGILQNIQQAVVVVAIVGLYRTGKSYLMNKLAGKDKGGFSLGATIQANTKGIWMWCRPHPFKRDHTLVLLDTEGLGDVEKSNTENDSWIFALSVLLSSTFVYNSMSTINHYALEQMHYVSELTNHIKTKASDGSPREDGGGFPDEFASFFPTFIWVVRDFTLQLALEDGRPITEDQYLEKALERKEEDLPESKLNPEFVEQARSFCDYIYKNAPAKRIQGGRAVTGSLLGTLAKSYTEAIRSGSIPCIENAVLALAQIENSAAVHEAVKRYEDTAKLMLMMPTKDVEELLRVHEECEEEALQVFMNRSFKDEDHCFQQEQQRPSLSLSLSSCTSQNQLQSKLQELCRQNEQASLDRCQAVLMELFQPVEQKIHDGSYMVPGGYQEFLKDQQNLVESYNMVPEKGLMAAKALQDFLQAKETTAQSILQTDQSLTEKEKDVEVAKTRAEASEREAQLQRKMNEKAQKMAQEMERSHKEHEKHLMAKMEQERKNLLAEQERLLNQKLQEQRRLQEESYKQEYSRFQAENAEASEVGAGQSAGSRCRVQTSLRRLRSGSDCKEGFALGATVQANTKGIWMWCVPYPERPDQTLVLLDTEGLGDVEKGDAQNDTWIFALAVLLSSTLVYNSMGTIDQSAMDRLHYVTELTEHIKAKATSGENTRGLEDSAEFVRFFPTFIWALRDFTLQLELNGRPITEDEYLENALKLKKGDTKDVHQFNLPRKCIRFYFPTRKCFIFERPTQRKNMHLLEKMKESELDPDFVEQAGQFRRYVYWTSKEKTIPGGHIVTGRLLAKLVENYVDSIRSGKVPCMENAVLALAELENSAALSQASARYVELMEKKLALPTQTIQQLLEIHAECEKEAVKVFMGRAFKDDKRLFQAKLMKTINEKKEDYCCKNELESRKVCEAALTSLSQELEDKVREGIYSCPDGYKHFVADLKKVEEKYHQQPKKGIMTDTVLQEFLKKKEDVGRTILQSDKTLTEKEKEMAEAKAKAEAAERDQELQKQQLAEQEQKMEHLKQSYETHRQQLEEKMKREREMLLEEHKMMMESKLAEQEAMLRGGFEKETRQLKEEIEHLRTESGKIKEPSWWQTALGGLLGAASLFVPQLRVLRLFK
ncbi:hypothetical protein JRQ81_011540 [Phrynocephalus forsythii]|uniref:GB1/RHD3-type G domain-containing protein n=1 Tax=Phrynocephalus forsythii TaxID=171643 RepID=A0A9Q0X621_9SAUR|nr:hypothetical protein JRQ81_011540 [Phrynocephalus forsythii]